ncbi:putative glycoprotein 3-alpha-L-fucosyltransferase A-like [Apostichopus japonicus]|uniref:Fucosyltransferase n=1 Tax=Stichopus japonicus TaxID=307972 RepID=A0A2G8KL01_STIJA|nr:putative glycoprotein 3-alpha-L-fucosyltransferase A-like [Apostichopus japonicus]
MKITSSINVEDLKEADAVLFFHKAVKPWGDLIRARPKGQLWIFFSRENPTHCIRCFPHQSKGVVFNMSMTYHSDSDVVVPYGTFTPFESTTKKKQHKDNPKLINWAENKTKSVLWVSSNCFRPRWDRLGFVEHLSTYLPVDMFGDCGNLSCPREENDFCDKIFSQYKFYLALENTPCREYITEKVWRNSLERGLIPVVFGADKSDYVKILPENSFIFAEDFNSTQQLARFLERVDRNDTLFNEYFKWRQLGYITIWTRASTFTPRNLCRVVPKIISLEATSKREKGLLRERQIQFEYQWRRSSCREPAILKFASV